MEGSMKSVGIDIGTSSIKVVEVNSTSKGIQISRMTEHPLNANPAFDPEIEIIEFLRGLSSTYDQATTRFVVALRQDQVSVRNKIFPFNERQKILKSLPFELEEELPFSNETAIFDAKIVRNIGGTAEVLACASPKNRVSTTLQWMADAGFEISVLSAEGIAFANCFEQWDQPIPYLPPMAVEIEQNAVERKIHLTIQIGHTRTLVCAFESGLLIGVRSILWGGKAIAEAISRRYEIPYIEALKEMQTKAFVLVSKEGASYDQIVFSDTIGNQLKELSRELKISILEFRAEFNGVVESVGITGGTSSILNLQAFLTQQLEIPVNKISVLNNFSNIAFEKTARLDSIIGVALGLAIEGLKKPRNPPINFMRGEFARQNTYLKAFWTKWGSTIQMSAAIFAVFWVYSMIRDTVAVDLADRTTESLKTQAKVVAKLPARSQNEAGVKKFIRDQNKRTAEMRTLSGLAKMNSAMDVVKKINDSLPGKSTLTVDVTKLTVKEDLVQFEGVVPNAKQFTILETALGTIAKGKPTRTSGTPVANRKPGVPFAFSFKVDRGLPNSQTQR
jgi:general secretion pathway protein L